MRGKERLSAPRKASVLFVRLSAGHRWIALEDAAGPLAYEAAAFRGLYNPEPDSWCQGIAVRPAPYRPVVYVLRNARYEIHKSSAGIVVRIPERLDVELSSIGIGNQHIHRWVQAENRRQASASRDSFGISTGATVNGSWTFCIFASLGL